MQLLGLDSLGQDSFAFLSASILVFPVCRALGLSSLIGFLVSGVVLRQLDLFADDSDEMALADFGVLCLLFQIGLELTLERIQKLALYAINLGLPALAISTAVFSCFQLPAGRSIGTQLLELVGNADPALVGIKSGVEAVVIGLGLSMSSSAFVLQLLREKKELDSRVGNAVVGVLLIQDVAVVPLLALLPVLQSLQDPLAPHPESLEGIQALGASCLTAILSLGIVVGISKMVAGPLLDKVSATFGAKSDALTASVLFTVAVASLCTKTAGFSDTLGAFLVGTLLADSAQKRYIDEALAPFRGLLLGLFFVTIGTTMNLSLFITDARSILLLLFGLLAVKAFSFALLGPPLTGLSRAESVRVGMLLAQGGEFAFVVFKVACDLQILPGNLNSLLIIVVVVSIALTPLLDLAGRALAEMLEDGEPGAKTLLSADAERRAQ